MILNQANLRAMQTSFSALFAKGMVSVTPKWPLLAMPVPSTTLLQAYPTWDQLPGMHEWKEDRLLRNLKFEQFTILNRDFEDTVEVDRNHIEDDMLGIFNVMIQAMGAQAALHPDVLLAVQLLNAFNAGAWACYDGKAMCATNHKLGTRTFSNAGTAALSPTSFAAARAALMTAYTNEGVVVTTPDKFYLVVSPDNYATAAEICNAGIVIGDATVGGSKDNIWKGVAQPVELPLLASEPNYWFLVAGFGPLRPIILQKRKEPQFVAMDSLNDESVFMKKKFRYGVDDRKNVGWSVFTLLYGSTGAA